MNQTSFVFNLNRSIGRLSPFLQEKDFNPLPWRGQGEVIVRISNFSFSLDWLIYLCLAFVLFVQIWGIFRVKLLTKLRFRVRLALNFLFWIVLLLFVIQPQWRFSSNTNRVLLMSENIPSATIRQVKDSLKITESFSIKGFSQRISEDPAFVENLGNIYLLGQDIDPEVLSQLSKKNLTFLPYFKQNELQNLTWKSIVRNGDLQEITGKIDRKSVV